MLKARSQKQPTQTQIHQQNTQSAMQWVEDLVNQGDTYQDAMAKYRRYKDQFLNDGVNTAELERHIYNRYYAGGDPSSYSASPQYVNTANNRKMGGFVPQ